MKSDPCSVTAVQLLCAPSFFISANEIFVMNLDGSGQRKLARGHNFAWSPDGSKIAYSEQDGIFVINADGSGRTRLTSRQYDLGANWSPNGRRIAFSRLMEPAGIYVADLDRSGLARITRPRRGGDFDPRWSPDGSRIVFGRLLYEGGHNGTDVFVVSADGSVLRRLTHGFGHNSPFWAPGGRRITFGGWSGGDVGSYEIYVMNADGSGLKDVSNTPHTSEGGPKWSPGGSRINFTSQKDIHVVAPSGRGHRNLTRGRGLDRDPSWSPDGRSIAFSSFRDGNWDIYTMSASGRGPTNLTNLTNLEKGIANRAPQVSPMKR